MSDSQSMSVCQSVTPFSAGKAPLGMQMSVSQSVCLSFTNTDLLDQFTSIFYNCKSDQMKLNKLCCQPFHTMSTM